MSQETLKKYGLFYRDEVFFTNSGPVTSKENLISCGSMVETAEGFTITVDKDLPKDSRVIAKPIEQEA